MPKVYSEEELEERYVWVNGGFFDKARWEKVGGIKMTGTFVGSMERYQDREFETSFIGGLFGLEETSKRLRDILPAKHPQSIRHSPIDRP